MVDLLYDENNPTETIKSNETAIYVLSGVFSFLIAVLIILVIFLIVQIQKLKRRVAVCENPDNRTLAKGHPDDLIKRGYTNYTGGLPRATSPQNDYNQGQQYPGPGQPYPGPGQPYPGQNQQFRNQSGPRQF